MRRTHGNSTHTATLSTPKTTTNTPSDRYIDGITHLPPAPTVATELLDLFNDKHADANVVVKLITCDPSLTAEVLKCCNSAFFRGREGVTTILSAVTRLGFNEVYRLVVSMLASRTMELAESGGAIDADTLWRHSLITAVASETLATRNRHPKAEAFTAGLLHDVGKLIFTSAEPVIYETIVAQVGNHGPMLIEMEYSQLGVTHAETGARLLERWGLPANVCAAVLHHHTSPLAPVQSIQLAATISIANIIAHQVGDSSGERHHLAPTLSPATQESMKTLALPLEQLPEVIRQTKKDLKRVEPLLSMVKTKTDPHGFPALVS